MKKLLFALSLIVMVFAFAIPNVVANAPPGNDIGLVVAPVSSDITYTVDMPAISMEVYKTFYIPELEIFYANNGMIQKSPIELEGPLVNLKTYRYSTLLTLKYYDKALLDNQPLTRPIKQC